MGLAMLAVQFTKELNPVTIALYLAIMLLAAKVFGLAGEPPKSKKKGKKAFTAADLAAARQEAVEERAGELVDAAHDLLAPAAAGAAVYGEPAATGERIAGNRHISEVPRLTTQEIQDLDFTIRTHDAIMDAHNRHGDFFTGNCMGMEALFVRDVRAARFALTKTPRAFKLDKGVVPDADMADADGFSPIARSNLLQPMFYGTVFHLEGMAHRKHRRAIANALAARAETGNAYVREVERELVNQWMNSEENVDGWHTVDVQKLSYLMMATGAIQVALGPEFELTPEIRAVLFKGVCECEAADPAVDVPLSVSGAERDIMFEVLDVLKAYVEKMPPSSDTKSALYGMQQQKVSFKEIAATLVNFAVAAGESPASGAAHTLATIARMPEIQEKCRAEADEFCPLTSESESELPDALDTQGHLEYTGRVVKESLRHRVPATMVSRVATEDTVLPAAGGHSVTIPEGTRVVVTISAAHYHDNEWPDPHTFDPDRFVTQDGKHPKGYLTFSAGPRMCPGERITMMWIQMLVALVLRRFEMRPLPGSDPWAFPHARKFVSWANGGVLCQVRPREDVPLASKQSSKTEA
jgi:cytochrome P450